MAFNFFKVHFWRLIFLASSSLFALLSLLCGADSRSFELISKQKKFWDRLDS